VNAVATLPQQMHVRIEVEGDFKRGGERPLSAYLPLLELALHASIRQLLADVKGAAGELRSHVTGVTDRTPAWFLRDLTHSKLTLHSLGEEALVRAVAGHGTFVVAAWDPFGNGGLIIEVHCTGASIEIGSFKGNFTVGIATAVLSGVIALAAPITHDLYTEYKQKEHIEAQYQGEDCFTNSAIRISAAELMRTTAQDLDYSDPLLSPSEREHRVCLAQTILNLTGAYPHEIDGKPGDYTIAGLMAVARKHGVSDWRIENPEMRRRLIDLFLEWRKSH
jgi:hypothetical protein